MSNEEISDPDFWVCVDELAETDADDGKSEIPTSSPSDRIVRRTAIQNRNIICLTPNEVQLDDSKIRDETREQEMPTVLFRQKESSKTTNPEAIETHHGLQSDNNNRASATLHRSIAISRHDGPSSDNDSGNTERLRLLKSVYDRFDTTMRTADPVEKQADDDHRFSRQMTTTMNDAPSRKDPSSSSMNQLSRDSNIITRASSSVDNRERVLLQNNLLLPNNSTTGSSSNDYSSSRNYAATCAPVAGLSSSSVAIDSRPCSSVATTVSTSGGSSVTKSAKDCDTVCVIGPIPIECLESELVRSLRRYGDIIDLTIVLERAFITFANSTQAHAATVALNGSLFRGRMIWAKQCSADDGYEIDGAAAISSNEPMFGMNLTSSSSRHDKYWPVGESETRGQNLAHGKTSSLTSRYSEHDRNSSSLHGTVKTRSNVSSPPLNEVTRHRSRNKRDIRSPPVSPPPGKVLKMAAGYLIDSVDEPKENVQRRSRSNSRSSSVTSFDLVWPSSPKPLGSIATELNEARELSPASRAYVISRFRNKDEKEARQLRATEGLIHPLIKERQKKEASYATNMALVQLLGKSRFDQRIAQRYIKMNDYAKCDWGERSFDIAFTSLDVFELGTRGQQLYKSIEKASKKMYILKKMQSCCLPVVESEGVPGYVLRELKLLRTLTHGNIVHIVDVICVRERAKGISDYYLVYENVPFSLQELLQREMFYLNFSSDDIALLTKQILSALSYCHKNNVIHRELSTANVLVNNRGKIKIAEFGLSQIFTDAETAMMDSIQQSLITLQYRAPELLLGALKCDSAVDIWSCGCIVGELFARSGHPLFPGKDDFDQLEVIGTLCGMPNVSNWPEVIQLPCYRAFKSRNESKMFDMSNRRRIAEMFSFVSVSARDMIDQMLTYDPRRRPSADDVLSSHWLSSFVSKSKLNIDLLAGVTHVPPVLRSPERPRVNFPVSSSRANEPTLITNLSTPSSQADPKPASSSCSNDGNYATWPSRSGSKPATSFSRKDENTESQSSRSDAASAFVSRTHSPGRGDISTSKRALDRRYECVENRSPTNCVDNRRSSRENRSKSISDRTDKRKDSAERRDKSVSDHMGRRKSSTDKHEKSPTVHKERRNDSPKKRESPSKKRIDLTAFHRESRKDAPHKEIKSRLGAGILKSDRNDSPKKPGTSTSKVNVDHRLNAAATGIKSRLGIGKGYRNSKGKSEERKETTMNRNDSFNRHLNAQSTDNRSTVGSQSSHDRQHRSTSKHSERRPDTERGRSASPQRGAVNEKTSGTSDQGSTSKSGCESWTAIASIDGTKQKVDNPPKPLLGFLEQQQLLRKVEANRRRRVAVTPYPGRTTSEDGHTSSSNSTTPVCATSIQSTVTSCKLPDTVQHPASTASGDATSTQSATTSCKFPVTDQCPTSTTSSGATTVALPSTSLPTSVSTGTTIPVRLHPPSQPQPHLPPPVQSTSSRGITAAVYNQPFLGAPSPIDMLHRPPPGPTAINMLRQPPPMDVAGGARVMDVPTVNLPRLGQLTVNNPSFQMEALGDRMNCPPPAMSVPAAYMLNHHAPATSVMGMQPVPDLMKNFPPNFPPPGDAGGTMNFSRQGILKQKTITNQPTVWLPQGFAMNQQAAQRPSSAFAANQIPAVPEFVGAPISVIKNSKLATSAPLAARTKEQLVLGSRINVVTSGAVPAITPQHMNAVHEALGELLRLDASKNSSSSLATAKAAPFTTQHQAILIESSERKLQPSENNNRKDQQLSANKDHKEQRSDNSSAMRNSVHDPKAKESEKSENHQKRRNRQHTRHRRRAADYFGDAPAKPGVIDKQLPPGAAVDTDARTLKKQEELNKEWALRNAAQNVDELIVDDSAILVASGSRIVGDDGRTIEVTACNDQHGDRDYRTELHGVLGPVNMVGEVRFDRDNRLLLPDQRLGHHPGRLLHDDRRMNLTESPHEHLEQHLGDFMGCPKEFFHNINDRMGPDYVRSMSRDHELERSRSRGHEQERSMSRRHELGRYMSREPDRSMPRRHGFHRSASREREHDLSMSHKHEFDRSLSRDHGHDRPLSHGHDNVLLEPFAHMPRNDFDLREIVGERSYGRRNDFEFDIIDDDSRMVDARSIVGHPSKSSRVAGHGFDDFSVTVSSRFHGSPPQHNRFSHMDIPPPVSDFPPADARFDSFLDRTPPRYGELDDVFGRRSPFGRPGVVRDYDDRDDIRGGFSPRFDVDSRCADRPPIEFIEHGDIRSGGITDRLGDYRDRGDIGLVGIAEKIGDSQPWRGDLRDNLVGVDIGNADRSRVDLRYIISTRHGETEIGDNWEQKRLDADWRDNRGDVSLERDRGRHPSAHRRSPHRDSTRRESSHHGRSSRHDGHRAGSRHLSDSFHGRQDERGHHGDGVVRQFSPRLPQSVDEIDLRHHISDVHRRDLHDGSPDRNLHLRGDRRDREHHRRDADFRR